MEITGKIFQILPIKEGVSKSSNNPWKMQPFILDIETQYSNKIYFEIFGEQRVNEILPLLREGETVTVSFDLSSREYNGSWFTSLRAWKVVPVNPSNQPNQPQAAPTQPVSAAPQPQTPASNAPVPPAPPVEPFNEEEEGTDLPF